MREGREDSNSRVKGREKGDGRAAAGEGGRWRSWGEKKIVKGEHESGRRKLVG